MFSVRGSKFPMATDVKKLDSEITNRTITLGRSQIGTGHDNFLNGIIVQFDLTFTIKAWTEAERYHFFDFVSSQSTMHKIASFIFIVVVQKSKSKTIYFVYPKYF